MKSEFTSLFIGLFVETPHLCCSPGIFAQFSSRFGICGHPNWLCRDDLKLTTQIPPSVLYPVFYFIFWLMDTRQEGGGMATRRGGLNQFIRNHLV